MGDIYYLRHNGEQSKKIKHLLSSGKFAMLNPKFLDGFHWRRWRTLYTPNRVHIIPIPTLALNYLCFMRHLWLNLPCCLHPTILQLSLWIRNNIFRQSLSLFYLFWFLLTFSALHSYPITSELKHKSCVASGGVYLSLCWHPSKRTAFKLWPTNERRRRRGSRPMRSEERVQSFATTCCPHLNPCSDFCGKSLVFHGHWCHMQT